MGTSEHPVLMAHPVTKCEQHGWDEQSQTAKLISISHPQPTRKSMSCRSTFWNKQPRSSRCGERRWIQLGTMKLWFDPWPCSVGWGPGVAVSWGVGRRAGLDPALLCLWRGLVAAAPIRLLAREPPHAIGMALKSKKKKKKFPSWISVNEPN